MSKPASLSSSLVAKKGEAAPVVVSSPPIHQEESATRPRQEVSPSREKAKQADEAAVKGYFKALTVKLDRDRYLKLKQLGLMRDQSSQDLFVEALDAFLKKASTQ